MKLVRRTRTKEQQASAEEGERFDDHVAEVVLADCLQGDERK